MTFEAWMVKVNKEVEAQCGLSIDDLPDCDYWTMWDSGKQPAAAARKVVKNAGAY